MERTVRGFLKETSVRSILTVQPADHVYGRKVWTFASRTSGSSRTGFRGTTRTVSARSTGVGAAGGEAADEHAAAITATRGARRAAVRLPSCKGALQAA